MQADEVRFLFAYDRWATRQVLNVLDGLDRGAWTQPDVVAYVHEGVPVWQMLVHVVNHGTQHRAEAATILTAGNRSPGELDLIRFAEEQAEQTRS